MASGATATNGGAVALHYLSSEEGITEAEVDEALEASNQASDLPGWTLGLKSPHGPTVEPGAGGRAPDGQNGYNPLSNREIAGRGGGRRLGPYGVSQD